MNPESTTANVRPTSFHHLAASTADMSGVLDFWCRVLGLELVGLFDMHGVPGGFHAFCRLNDASAMSFVFLPKNAEIAEQVGVTHARNGADSSAPGTTQHLALGVETEAELYGMRDRLRSHGYRAMGPIDHGFCKSIYFRGPEGAALEISYYSSVIDPDHWIDPEVAANCGIDPQLLDTLKNPPAFVPPDSPVLQPAEDPAKPDLRNPSAIREMLDAMSDQEILETFSFSDPPVP